MIINNLSTLKIHKLTQAQYDREVANGTIDENAIYLTPDEENGGSWTEEQKEEIKAYVREYINQVILGGEW